MNLITLLISNSDLFDKMYQEINRQNTFYFWIIGIVVTVSIAIAAFIGILQWRLSDKQIAKMKRDTEDKIVKDYSLDGLKDKVDSGLDEFNNFKTSIAQKTFKTKKIQVIACNGWFATKESKLTIHENDSFKIINASFSFIGTRNETEKNAKIMGENLIFLRLESDTYYLPGHFSLFDDENEAEIIIYRQDQTWLFKWIKAPEKNKTYHFVFENTWVR